MLTNQCSFRHSSQNLPLKPSTYAFSIGLPGRMKQTATPRMWAHASSVRPANSGPLSSTMRFGRPSVAASRSRTRTTRAPGSDRSTSIARTLARVVVDPNRSLGTPESVTRHTRTNWTWPSPPSRFSVRLQGEGDMTDILTHEYSCVAHVKSTEVDGTTVLLGAMQGLISG